jgi:GTP-binding protein
MLIDEALITVKAGNGGDGAVSFRREKYVAKGGPDGGDGGNGGHVLLMATNSTHGLAQFRGTKDFKAQEGERGGRNKRHGADGEDLIITIPPGTMATEIMHDGTEHLLLDFLEEGQSIRVARGGRGGKGNWHFRGPQNQTPRQFQPGTPGQKLTIKLELQVIADVGLIGQPNAGKSTLLSIISNAKPKIADYPFTTLQPNLGMVVHHDAEFVAADIPGLIEGAAEGKGLGIEFLKHVERTRVLVHLIAVTEEDPEKTYQAIRKELTQYDTKLAEKKELVVLSKIDLDPDWKKNHAAFIKKHKALTISAASNVGVDALLTKIVSALK